MSAPASPLTGSSRVKLIAAIRAEQLITDWRSQFEVDISDDLKGVSEVAVYRCFDTGLVFFWPPSLEGSHSLYSKLQDVGGYYREDKWEHSFALKYLKAGDVVLEVGCGTGEFLKRASGLVASAAGIDVNEGAVAVARSKGLAAHVSPFAAWVTENPISATVCCAFQVLEHVSDPRGFIELCIRSVRPNGRIIFGTPNAAGYLRYQYDLLDLPPHHMSRWDVRTFRALEKIFPLRLRRYGFEPLQAWNVDLWASTVAKRSPFFVPKDFAVRAARKIAHSAANRFIAGHSLCVVFERE